jgi:hypothetical protein
LLQFSPFFRTHRSLSLENLVLRQQLTVLKRKHRRPWLGALDKLFWVLASKLWSGWKQALIAFAFSFTHRLDIPKYQNSWGRWI